MKIYENHFIKDENQGCVLALGNFDGLHKGHLFLLEKAKKYATENGLIFGIYTFSKHPKTMFGKRHEMIMTLQEKMSFLANSAVKPDFVYLEEFNAVKDFSPEEFADMIVEKFGVECTFCGENFTFGKGASGNSITLCKLMNDRGKNSVSVKPLEIDGVVVSSTEIRGFLHDGFADKAAEFLAEPYSFTTQILHGASLGRKLGFPTVNQNIPDEKIIPAFGVYCSVVIIDGKEYLGVTNVGVKPTVSGDERQVLAETHILDFNEDVYGKFATTILFKKLRGEQKFRSLSELTENIAENVKQTREYFKDLKNEK